MMIPPWNNQPMNPQQLRQLQRRVDQMSEQAANAPMPTDIGSGLQQLGNSIGLAFARGRLNSQFPAAPTLPGAAPVAQPLTPMQRVTNAVLGRMNPQRPGPTAGMGAPVPAPAPYQRPLLADDEQRGLNPHGTALGANQESFVEKVTREYQQDPARKTGGLW